jgi:23S rRNA maturation mini-RNase III
MRQVVQLRERGLAAVSLSVLLNRVAHTPELGRDAARHVGPHALAVALELLDNQLRHEERQPTLVGENSHRDDELRSVDRLGEVQPYGRISQSTRAA